MTPTNDNTKYKNTLTSMHHYVTYNTNTKKLDMKNNRNRWIRGPLTKSETRGKQPKDRPMKKTNWTKTDIGRQNNR